VPRWDPTTAESSVDTYYVDTGDCGPMVLDGPSRSHIDPTLTFRRSPRRRLRLLRHEHRRPETLACTKSIRREGWRRQDQPLPHQPVVGPRSTSPISTRNMLDRAGQTTTPTPKGKQSHEDREADGSTNASCAPAARPPARNIGTDRFLGPRAVAGNTLVKDT
jgi:succinate dehydrogenase / fumarate reductase iron-sulfur subunit